MPLDNKMSFDVNIMNINTVKRQKRSIDLDINEEDPILQCL